MKELPPGWVWTTIGEIASTSLGKMLDKKRATGLHPTPYLRNINVRWGTFDLSDVASMDIRPEEMDRVLAQPGDVIVCEGGEPSRAAVWRRPEPIALQKALHRVRPTDAVSPEYLVYLLWHLAGSGHLERLFTGTTIKHLPQEKLRVVRLPLAPRAEQELIVAAIEEHFSRLDAVEFGLGKVDARHGALRDAILQQFVDSASPRIPLAQALSGAVFTDGDWVESKDQDPAGEVRLVQLADVGVGSFRDRSSRFLTTAKAEELRCTVLRAGDVLVARMPDPLGRACLLPDLGQPSVTAVDVCILRPPPNIDSKWVMWSLNSPAARRQVRDLQSGTTRARISRRNLALVRIPLPGLEEQRRRVAELEAMLSKADAIKAVTRSTTQRASTLRRSILAAAFRGRLSDHESVDPLLATASATVHSSSERVLSS